VSVKKGGYFGVEKFLEKPDLDKAKKYFKDKKFFWNSGMFIWKASVFLDEARKYLPELYANLKLINSAEDIAKIWPRIKPISVDYGIMEHSKRIALIPAAFYWTDLGSWDALAEVFPKDKKGNIENADTLNIDSQGVCVFARGNRLVSTIGLNNIVIADTPDALLVCDRGRTQDVKQMVERLKTLKRKEHQVHLTERRPWGSFTVLQQDLGFKIKLIELAPKKRLSLQRHKSRAEHWVVVSGTAKVLNGGKVSFVRSNESIYIPKGKKHRLENPLKVPLKIVEVQTGVYLEEDDIERFEDDFIQECR
jgi:mannose-1-phosphate guanylyltransferase/mannose-6-phosphate isomerase